MTTLQHDPAAAHALRRRFERLLGIPATEGNRITVLRNGDEAVMIDAGTGIARLIEGGMVRINRQPTDKAHARLRPGDVLTLPLGGPERGQVRVIEVLALATRRGPAVEARTLYREVLD